MGVKIGNLGTHQIMLNAVPQETEELIILTGSGDFEETPLAMVVLTDELELDSVLTLKKGFYVISVSNVLIPTSIEVIGQQLTNNIENQCCKEEVLPLKNQKINKYFKENNDTLFWDGNINDDSVIIPFNNYNLVRIEGNLITAEQINAASTKGQIFITNKKNNSIVSLNLDSEIRFILFDGCLTLTSIPETIPGEDGEIQIEEATLVSII